MTQSPARLRYSIVGELSLETSDKPDKKRACLQIP